MNIEMRVFPVDQQLPCAAKTGRDETLFPFGVRVLDRGGERVLEHALRIGKRHPVLLYIRSFLGGVVAEPHAATIYILYVYGKKVRP